MRVLHICEASLGGAGRHVLELVEAQAKHGVEVHFLYSTKRSDKAFLKGLEALKQMTAGPILRELDMTRSPGPTDIRAMMSLRRYLRIEGPFDIVHSHCTKAGFLARVSALGASKQFYTPNAFLSLSEALPRAFRWLVGLGEVSLARATARIVAVSEEEYEYAISLGIPRHKLVLIPNGSDVRRVYKDAAALRTGHREQLGIGDDTVCIGFVGRLTYQKNPELLVRVIAELPQAVRARIQVAAIGNGELKDSLEGLSRSMGVEKCIRWLGEQDSLSWMSAFDVFMMTSRYEGLPYVLLDALAYGLPVVTTAVGGVSLLLREGVNAFLAEPGDSATLARRLRELVESPDLRASMSKASVARSRFFTLDRMVHSTLNEYWKAVNGGAVPLPARSVPSDTFRSSTAKSVRSSLAGQEPDFRLSYALSVTAAIGDILDALPTEETGVSSAPSEGIDSLLRGKTTTDSAPPPGPSARIARVRGASGGPAMLDFAIVGAPRCGTTSLYDALSRHPGVSMSAIKEPHFFATDLRGRRDICCPEDYERLFQRQREGQLRGEMSVFYLYSSTAVPSILERNTRAKFVALVRSPLDLYRSYHNALLNCLDEDQMDPRRAWELQDDRAKGNRIPHRCSEPLLLQYRQICSLGQQTDRLLKAVPAEQRLVVVFEDLIADPSACLQRICRFLGISADVLSDLPRKNEFGYPRRFSGTRLLQSVYKHPRVSRTRIGAKLTLAKFGISLPLYAWVARLDPRKAQVVPQLSPSLREMLKSELSSDTALLETLLHRSFAHWWA